MNSETDHWKLQWADDATAARWAAVLEDHGLEAVRLRLAAHQGGSASMLGYLGSETMTRGFVEEWVRRETDKAQRRETRRFRMILIWTVVAAVAGIVAAVTGVMALLR